MAEHPETTPSRPRRLGDVSQWDMETDVAIVGFGGAGACAAIEATDAGADVCIFELASASGGSTELSSGEVYMGGNGGTRVQRACGYEDSTEDMFNYLMAAQGELADEAKIRMYCENSRDHFDWLVKMGAKYKDSEYKDRAIMAPTDDCLLYTGNEKSWPFRDKAKPCPRGHNLEIVGDNGGPLLMGILASADLDREQRQRGARPGGPDRRGGTQRPSAQGRHSVRWRLCDESGDAEEVHTPAQRRQLSGRQPG